MTFCLPGSGVLPPQFYKTGLIGRQNKRLTARGCRHNWHCGGPANVDDGMGEIEAREEVDWSVRVNFVPRVLGTTARRLLDEEKGLVLR